MRRILAGFASLVFLASCGGADSPTGPSATAKVFFKIDALTCSGTSAVQFYIDGSLAGTETISAGQTSQGYATTGGSHVLGARVTDRNYVWPNTTVTVPNGGIFTQVLPCA
jgi:hypothetical protein